MNDADLIIARRYVRRSFTVVSSACVDVTPVTSSMQEGPWPFQSLLVVCPNDCSCTRTPSVPYCFLRWRLSSLMRCSCVPRAQASPAQHVGGLPSIYRTLERLCDHPWRLQCYFPGESRLNAIARQFVGGGDSFGRWLANLIGSWSWVDCDDYIRMRRGQSGAFFAKLDRCVMVAPMAALRASQFQRWPLASVWSVSHGSIFDRVPIAVSFHDVTKQIGSKSIPKWVAVDFEFGWIADELLQNVILSLDPFIALNPSKVSTRPAKSSSSIQCVRLAQRGDKPSGLLRSPKVAPRAGQGLSRVRFECVNNHIFVLTFQL